MYQSVYCRLDRITKIVLMACCLYLPCRAEKTTTTVLDFYNAIDTYVKANDHTVDQRIHSMCVSGFRSSDKLSQEQQNVVKTHSIQLDEYLTIFRNAKASIEVLPNLREIPNYDNYRTQNIPNCRVVEAYLNVVSGSPKYPFNYRAMHILVYMDSENKIHAIGDYDTDFNKIGSLLTVVDTPSFTYSDIYGNKGPSPAIKAAKGSISYLSPNIKLYSAKEITDTIWHKIYCPKGNVWGCSKCDCSKNGFTYGTVVQLNKGINNLNLVGFGCDSGACWTCGTYVWEFWYKNEQLASKSFLITHQVKPVGDMTFKFEDTAGLYQLAKEDGVKLGQATYIYPKLFLKANETFTDTIWIKVIKPNGKLDECSGCTFSKHGYTYGCVTSFVKDSIISSVNLGYGSKTGTLWTEGTYVWQVWMGGEMLASKNFIVQSNIRVSSVSFAAKYMGTYYNEYDTPLCKEDIKRGYLYAKIKLQETPIYKDTIYVSISNYGKSDRRYSVPFSPDEKEVEVALGDSYNTGNIKCIIYDGSGKELYSTTKYIRSGSAPSFMEKGDQSLFGRKKIVLHVENVQNWSYHCYSDKFRTTANKKDNTITVWSTNKSKGWGTYIYVKNEDNNVESKIWIYDNK